MTRVKICGITTLEDALAAVNAGAHALGFVFPDSPRQVTPGQVRQILLRLPPWVSTVGVFVDASLDQVNATLSQTGLQMAQLHGKESPEYCTAVPRPVIKRVYVDGQSSPETLLAEFDRYEVAAYLLDPGGGCGERFDWARFTALRPEFTPVREGGNRHLVVAGGLDPENVRDAITLLQPFAVDVCTGVEVAPGRKDVRKVGAFLRAVEEADALNVVRH